MFARLIVIEGSDGAGKETQADLLAGSFRSQGRTVAKVSFPRYRETLGGMLIWEVLKSDRAYTYNFAKSDPRLASMMYAADRKESLPLLRQLIEKNDVVILDRYVESNLLHQGGKFATEEERILFAKWLYDLEYGDNHLPKPHKVVYLSLPFWLSRKRAELRAAQTGGTLDAVERDTAYVKAGHESGLFYANHFDWSVIDCLEGERELTRAEVHKKICDVVDNSSFTRHKQTP